MKLILISNPVTTMSEYDTIEMLMDQGVDQFHLRKPDGSEEGMLKYLNRLPKPSRKKITIHGYSNLAHKYDLNGLHLPLGESFGNWEGKKSRSFHSFEEVEKCTDTNYGFLSPVFDSISKEGYKSAFAPDEIKSFLSSYKGKTKLYALGGVDQTNVAACMKMGFDGVAIMGAIWSELWVNKKLEKLKIIRETIDSLGV